MIHGLTPLDCGPACLAMVLGFHGRAVRLDELRDVVAAGASTALALVEAARSFELDARGVRLELEDLADLDAPAILHWNFNHFVVLERAGHRSIDVADPSAGRRRVPMEEVRRAFTGIALVLEPNARFVRASLPNRTWASARRVLSAARMLGRVLLLSAFLQILALGVPVLTGAVVDSVVPSRDYDLLLVLYAGLASIVACHFAASFLRARLLLYMKTHLDSRLTTEFVEHLVDLPYSFFARRRTGDLVMRLNSNAIIREIITSSVLSGALDAVLGTVFLTLLFVASPSIGLIVVGLAIAQIGTFWLSHRRRRELMSENLELQSTLQAYQVEMLGGMETLKMLGCERRAAALWTDQFVEVLNSSVVRGRLTTLVDGLLGTVRVASPMLVLAVGTIQVLDGRLTLGTMLALNALANGFLAPLSSVIGNATQFQLLSSYFARIDDVLDTPTERALAAPRSAGELQGRVALQAVSFRYAPGAREVLREVSFEVQPGEFVAIVGRSGAGKTTLASLLAGLYPPTSGRVLFDGVDLAETEIRSLRRQLGVVAQQPTLFAMSVKDNIGLANPDLTPDEIVAAARLAHIHDDIEALPLGYETMLLDRGAALSGGQRQRLALARALVSQPAILVLDEATSALDAALEARVLESLAALRCTRIVIAHRMSTTRAADRIVLLDGGRVIEEGRHDDLVARRGIYAELVAAQRDAPPAGTSGR